MKICLISGIYKPNHCGISDYIKLLSAELKCRGIEIVHFTINQIEDLSHLAKNLPEAEIYSIQFAPYLFSKHGLSGGSLIELSYALKGKKTHVNFHEIWIGAYPSAPLKEKLYGWRQKREIVKFLKTSKPHSITCSNAAVLDRLHRENIDAKYLYLFGNIAYFKFQKKPVVKMISIAIFGTLYEKFPYNNFFQKLTELATTSKQSIELIIMGRQRDGNGLTSLEKVAQEFKIKLRKYGELSPKSISHHLQQCDIGVCTTPYDVLGKSGATAAMLEHRLPVIAFDDGDTKEECLFVMKEFEEQIFLLNEPSFTDRLKQYVGKERKPFFDGVTHTANEMLNLIN